MKLQKKAWIEIYKLLSYIVTNNVNGIKKFEKASSSLHPWKLMSVVKNVLIVNSWQILLNCLVMFSCLHLTSACIQVSLLCTGFPQLCTVNSKSCLLRFDWLFQTFWHWRALLSRRTEPDSLWPERAKLIRIFDSSGQRWPFVWADGGIKAVL